MGKAHIYVTSDVSVSSHRLYADGGQIGLVFPPNQVEFAAEGDEVTWHLTVESFSGTGTWSLGVRVLDVIEHTSGPQYSAPRMVPFTRLQTERDVVEGIGWGKPALRKMRENPAYDHRQFIENPAYSASSDPRAFLVNPAYDPRVEIPSGVQLNAGEFGIIADNTDALPVTVTRTVRVRSLRHRIALLPTFASTASPYLRIGIENTVRRVASA